MGGFFNLQKNNDNNDSSSIGNDSSMGFFNLQKNNDSSIDSGYSKTISAMHSESLQSVPVSQLMAPEDIKKSAEEEIYADDALDSDLESDYSTTRVHDEKKKNSTSSAGASIFGDNNNEANNDNENENENGQSFLDKISTKKYVRLVVIGTIAFFILDVILLCLFLK